MQTMKPIYPLPDDGVAVVELWYYPPRSWRTLWQKQTLHTAAVRLNTKQITGRTATYIATQPIATQDAQQWVNERARTLQTSTL